MEPGAFGYRVAQANVQVNPRNSSNANRTTSEKPRKFDPALHKALCPPKTVTSFFQPWRSNITTIQLTRNHSDSQAVAISHISACQNRNGSRAVRLRGKGLRAASPVTQGAFRRTGEGLAKVRCV